MITLFKRETNTTYPQLLILHLLTSRFISPCPPWIDAIGVYCMGALLVCTTQLPALLLDLFFPSTTATNEVYCEAIPVGQRVDNPIEETRMTFILSQLYRYLRHLSKIQPAWMATSVIRFFSFFLQV